MKISIVYCFVNSGADHQFLFIFISRISVCVFWFQPNSTNIERYRYLEKKTQETNYGFSY